MVVKDQMQLTLKYKFLITFLDVLSAVQIQSHIHNEELDVR